MPPPSPPEHFHGYVSNSPTTPLTYATYTPKPFTPTDIEISITHCGICGTDLHTLRSGWGPNTTTYPCIVGHEIIGIVTRIGSSIPTYPNTTPLRIGDRVGIGAQTHSCLQPSCEECVAGKENYCPRITGTYNSRYWDNETGKRSDVIAYGGFARKWRGPAAFAFRIPERLESEVAAPLLCAGTTVFAPLRKYLGDGADSGKGKTVAVVGIGGLGHLGIMFAKALGCERVIGISRSNGKREDAVKGLGADEFIATGEEKGWEKRWSRSVDLILCTVDGDDMPLGKYLRLLKAGGTFVLVGAPEKPLPRMRAFELIGKGVNVTGSNIGSREDIRCMLEVAAEKGVRPWVETRRMEEVNETLRDMEAGRARFRYVLVNGEERESRL
ncbi:alcohol dehydrogenase [Aspergillus eucalypticola CBS 122712]|uniref:alcohol dehydrogenase (NADP(+)) n=1 Tax=Aspergillus eucalypticola (strain CBS 122712 / IBT 29274) TaxID=1448314 RepID=A0A317ULF0_ASPEC|nr:alcohol dehydrogenase [Aspergillus eucalypticola CBS 122712]PWY62764.1 alcohol dehydrogenase [Aspergillus eucalypticola CBS 122712]